MVRRTLLDTERDTYQSMWAVPDYSANSPGEDLVPIFLDMARPPDRGSILDAGCGSGKGARALAKAGFEVTLCDLTTAGVAERGFEDSFCVQEACLWHRLQPVAYLAKAWYDQATNPSKPNPYDGERFDYVYCCDVLEHIPPTFAMLVVSRLLEVARRGVFLSISLEPDNFGVWTGRQLHHTVQSFVAWRDQLAELATIQECRDLLNNGVYYLAQ